MVVPYHGASAVIFLVSTTEKLPGQLIWFYLFWQNKNIVHAVMCAFSLSYGEGCNLLFLPPVGRDAASHRWMLTVAWRIPSLSLRSIFLCPPQSLRAPKPFSPIPHFLSLLHLQPREESSFFFFLLFPILRDPGFPLSSLVHACLWDFTSCYFSQTCICIPLLGAPLLNLLLFHLSSVFLRLNIHFYLILLFF